MARITEVKKARKPQGNCSRCGDPIERGDPYRHASPGFHGGKIVRCMKAGCAFRASDLTTSKMAEVYAGFETAEEDIRAATTVEDVHVAFENLAEVISEVASEYRDAAEAMGDAGVENEERADTLDDLEQEVSNARYDLTEPGEEEEEEVDNDAHLVKSTERHLETSFELFRQEALETLADLNTV